MSDIGLLAAVLFGYSLRSRRLERALVSAPMFFVAAGIVLGHDLAGSADPGAAELRDVREMPVRGSMAEPEDGDR